MTDKRFRIRRGRTGSRGSLTGALSYGALSFVSNSLVAVASSIVVARLYGIDVVGEFALVAAPTSALWQLSTVREQIAFVREISNYEPRAPRITGFFWAMLGFSTALTALVAALAAVTVEVLYRGPVDRPDLIAPALVSLAAYVLITNPGWNIDAVFAAFRAGQELNLVRLHQVVLFLILVAVAAEASTSVWVLVAAGILSQVTSVVHRLVYLPRYMTLQTSHEDLRAGMSKLPEFIRFGLRVAPGDLADGISKEVGIWVISITSSITALGAYSRAWLISTRLVDFNFRITEVLFPSLVERWQLGDRRGFERAIVTTLRYSGIALLLPAAVGGGAAVGVMQIYGSEFVRASDALAVALAVPAIATMATIHRQPLLAVGRPTAASACSIAGLAVTAVATVIGANVIGLAGAALGALLGYAFALFLAVLLTRREIAGAMASLWPLRQRLALFGAYAAGFLIARGVDGALDSIPGLFLALLAGTVAYVLTFYVSRGVTPDDRNRLRSMRSSLGVGRSNSSVADSA